MSDNYPIVPPQQEGESLLTALSRWFGVLSGKNVRTIIVKDHPFRSMVRTMLGGIAVSSSEGSEIQITFNEGAQVEASKGEAEAAKVEADGNRQAHVIEAQGHAVAAKIQARRQR